MRVLQLVQKPQRRGAEIFAADLSRQLRRLGHTVRIVYLYPYGGDKPLRLSDDDRQLVGHELHWSEKLPGAHFGLLRHVQAEIQTFQPDIVQVNGARSVKYGTIARRWAGHNAEWRLVYRNIGDPKMWNRRRWGVWLYRHLLMPQVDGIVGVSQLSMDNAIEMYKLRCPHVYLPRGIDTDQLRPREKSDCVRKRWGAGRDDCLVVFAGNLAPEKRPDRFLRIIAAARRRVPKLRAWLLGDGVLRDSLQILARELNLQDTVKFLGYCDHVADIFAAADMFALTSDTEGTPGVVLEAGFLGLPVVATNVGGVPEVVLDKKTGLLADREDEPALVNSLVRLAESAAEREQMGQAARRWVQERFTLETVAQRYVEFYERVLRDTGAKFTQFGKRLFS